MEPLESRPEGGSEAEAQGEIAALRREMSELREQFRTVSDLGMKLASALDPTALLPAILGEARQFTRSEAGSLYVRRDHELVFAVTQNERLPEQDKLPDIRLPLDGSSLAGLAATEKRTLNIADARIHPAWRGRADFAYEVQSMLVVPMVDHRGDVLGVLQLMNARDAAGRIVSYPAGEAYLCGVLASHAATAMEIARLYSELEHVFESLVVYSTKAIDARDACTSGHSSRVARWARMLAVEMGDFTPAELREIRFAGIFHDVGKIGVRESVLTKGAKIQEGLAAIEARFHAAAEAAFRVAREGGAGGWEEEARRHAADLMEELAFVVRVDTPSWLADEDLARLAALRARTYRDWRGEEVALLTEGEHERLSVRKGNLTASERREIERHVELSHAFLEKIPFPKELRGLPEMVYSHHEKMNGCGYPRGLSGDQISRQSRILAVADVYDALTASDRPYKKAIPPARAVEIIETETAQGSWAPEVVAALRRLLESGQLTPRRQPVAAAESPLQAHEIW